MLYFLTYLVVVIATYRFISPRMQDGASRYATEGETRLGAICYSALWPLTIPVHLIWGMFGLITPKPRSEVLAEQRDEIEKQKRELFALQVRRADLEHENGFEPIDPPKGWVPKDDWRRHSRVDYRLPR